MSKILRTTRANWSQLTVAVLFVLLIVCQQNLARGELVEEEIISSKIANSSDEVVHRMKRWLIFNNGGLVKNVLGILIPVQFGDNSKRSLNMGYNFQSQFLVPPTPISPLKSPFFTGLFRNSRSIANVPDESRRLVYNALETTWERRGRNGYECILRAICEVAESPFGHNGLFGEVVDTIFTPNSDLEDTDFHSARLAGLRGADCGNTYMKCPAGEGFLDSISHFFDH